MNNKEPSSSFESHSSKELKALFWPSLIFTAFLSGLLYFGISYAPVTHQNYHTFTADNLPLIAQHTGITVIYGGWILLISIIALSINVSYCSIIGRNDSKASKLVMNKIKYVIIIGIVATFLGRYIGNSYWSEFLSNHHYSACQNSFAMTGKWAKRIWVDDPLLCRDQEITSMLRSYNYDISDVNEFITQRRNTTPR